jgi:hypothetical protein
MMIQPLLRSHGETAGDGRASPDDESPNEIFARALAQSIQVTRGSDPDTPLRGIPDGRTRTGFDPAESRLDPRSDVAVSRPVRNDRPEQAYPPVDRSSQPGVDRSDDPRAEDRRAEDRRPDDARADEHRAEGPRDDAGNGRAVVARPGEGTERPGAQVVDPAGNPLRPDTPGSDNGKRVAFANEIEGADQSGALEGDEAVLAAALASLMGVDTGHAVAFLETLMAGLTRSQGVESGEQLMAQLAALAGQLADGDTVIGVDGADDELVAAVIEAAVDAGLVEPTAPDADTDPVALLAALTAAIPVAGTEGAETDESNAIEAPPTTVDDSGAGSVLDAGSGPGLDGQLTDLDHAENAETEIAGDTAGPDGNADAVTEIAGDTAGPDKGGGGGDTGAGTSVAADSPDAAPDRVGTAPATTRPGDPSMATSSTAPGGLGAVSGVGTVGPTPTAPATAPARTPAQGLVELANTQLAEQLRPAFAAVRRGIDGLEELQLRLRNEGGAPIKVDIRTVDGDIRVVLSGTNDDVMQRLGHERERLADELRRAGFTSTTIDVHSDGADGDNRRFGATTTPETFSGRSYDTNRLIDDERVDAGSGSERSATTGLDLDL